MCVAKYPKIAVGELFKDTSLSYYKAFDMIDNNAELY